MDFYQIDILGDTNNDEYDDYCFADGVPQIKGTHWTRLRLGRPFGEDYPKDISDVTYKMSPDDGLKKTSFLANTQSILAVAKSVADVIMKFKIGPIEVLPFLLINPKGRVHSNDYVFLNPLQLYDAVHEKQSKILYHSDGRLLSVDKLVLDANKLDDAPDLFRLKQAPDHYIFSKRLVEAFSKHQFVNFKFDKLKTA